MFKCVFSLAPKSYFAIDFEKTDDDKDKSKRSSKGVQHSIRLTYNDYKDVLYGGEAKMVTNTTLRLHDHKMTTMQTRKLGLTNVYVKAFVNTDQITVTPFFRYKSNKE